jgi:hypothetical protein
LNIERAAHDDGREGFSALKKEMDDLSRAMNIEKKKFGCLRWENFIRDKARAEQHINDLTGVRSIEVFLALYDLFNIDEAAENLKQWNAGLEYTNKPRSKSRKLRPIDGMFLCMIRLRTGMTEEHVAWLFGVGQSTVSRVFEMWLMHMHVSFQVCFPPPDAKMRQHSCPKEFVAKFKTNYAYIVDCSDLEMKVGSDPQIQHATWSDYHHLNGAKFLGAITPCGAFAHSSKAYPARATDNAVTELLCGFLEFLEKGDTIVADKGFTVFYLLNKLEVSLYIPPFKRVGQEQFTTEELMRTSKVANLRIHIERAFERTKKFKIFDRPLQITMIDLATPLFYVCSMLTNLQNPLVNRKETTYTDSLNLYLPK